MVLELWTGTQAVDSAAIVDHSRMRLYPPQGDGSLALRASIAVVILRGAILPASAEDAKRVLFAHSFGLHFSPFSSFAAEMRRDLVRGASGPLDIYEVSLETARFAGPDAATRAEPFVTICSRCSTSGPSISSSRSGDPRRSSFRRTGRTFSPACQR